MDLIAASNVASTDEGPPLARRAFPIRGRPLRSTPSCPSSSAGSMTHANDALLRASFVVLAAHRGGWGSEGDLAKTLDALRRYVEHTDPNWVAEFDRLAVHGASNALMGSDHGRTLERFNGYLTQLFVLVAQTVDAASASVAAATPAGVDDPRPTLPQSAVTPRSDDD